MCISVESFLSFFKLILFVFFCAFVSYDNKNEAFDTTRTAAVGAIFRQFATMLITNNKVDVLDSSGHGQSGDDADSGVVIGGSAGHRGDGSLGIGGGGDGGGRGGGSGNSMRKGGYSAQATTRLENTHLDTTSSGHSMLDSNRVRQMNPYFAYSAVTSHAIQEFFEVCYWCCLVAIVVVD